jgi:hypothetical protein
MQVLAPEGRTACSGTIYKTSPNRFGQVIASVISVILTSLGRLVSMEASRKEVDHDGNTSRDGSASRHAAQLQWE